MKIPSTELRYVNQLPSSLADLLETILNPSDTSASHRSFVEAVMAAKVANDEGRADSDEGIKFKIEASHKPRQAVYFDAYVQYLGMTLHYHEQLQSDAAWYYYAQSRYYKGLVDTRESVLRQIEACFQSTEAKRQGGIKKAAKQTGEMKDELLKIIQSPPPGGWINLKQLSDSAEKLLKKFHISTKQIFPEFHNIGIRLNKWLLQDQRISKAFVENSSDPEKAIFEISKRGSDPNTHF